MPSSAFVMGWETTTVMVLVTSALWCVLSSMYLPNMAMCKQQLRTTPAWEAVGRGCCHASQPPHPPHSRLPHCLRPHCSPCQPLHAPAVRQDSLLPTTLHQRQHIAHLTGRTMPLQLLQALSPRHHPVLAALGQESLSGLKSGAYPASVCMMQFECALGGEQVHSSLLPRLMSPLALLCFVHRLLSYACQQMLQHAVLSS